MKKKRNLKKKKKGTSGPVQFMQNYLLTFQRAPSDRRGLGVHARIHLVEKKHTS